ncbi:MAG: hypothetical protein ACFFFK_01465 [Candidatus Thorarchaeota archaeon]
MNTTKRVSVALLSVIFLVALVSAVPVEAKKDFSVYRWWTEYVYTGSPEWTGDVWTGGPDDKYGGEHGVMYWDNDDDLYRFLGPDDPDGSYKVQKFEGIWWIEWDDGDYIEGTHHGSWSAATVTPIINGKITVATGDWAYLLGRNVKTFSTIDLASFTIDGYFQIN